MTASAVFMAISSALSMRIDDGELHRDVVAGGIGVRADLVSLLHQRLRIAPSDAWHRDLERNVQAIAGSFGSRSDAHGSLDGGVRGNLRTGLRADDLQRA